jgi:O-antigen/teichoic acid export membrane protein
MNNWSKLKRVYTAEFFKYVTALLSSNVIAQLIGLIAYPFITRIYSKEIFGEFNWFLSVAGLLIILSTGKYDPAIVLPKSERKAISLFQLCLVLNFLLFIFSLSAVVFWGDAIASLFSRNSLSRLLIFLPFMVLLGGLWQALNFFFIRRKKYYHIGLYNVAQSLVGVVLKCVLGLKGFVHSGLIVGSIAGQGVAFLICFLKSGFRLNEMKAIDRTELKAVAKAYAFFPRYELPNELLNTLSGALPVLLLSVYFEMEAIGLFSLALTVGFRPVNLFSLSVYQVLYKKTTERIHRKARIGRHLVLFCKTCVIVFLPFFILFAFISEWAFGILFGADWTAAGVYLRMMLPWLFLVVITASLSFIPDLFSKQRTAMHIEMIFILFRVISLAAGIYFRNFDLAIALYCGISAIRFIVLFVWYFHLVKKYESQV